MEREVNASVFVGLLILFFNSCLRWASADFDEVVALAAVKSMVEHPLAALRSWDNSLISTCTMIFTECKDDRTIRLDVGGYKLTGKLAPEIGNFKELRYLALYDNNFYGEVPSELGNLTELVSLDLRGNNFTGPIPSWLGQLKHLKFLWLQDNKLTGAIPPSLTGLSNLKVLHLENNDLSGKIPYEGALQRFNASRFSGNSNLCGKPLSKKC